MDVWDNLALQPLDESDIFFINKWQNDPQIRDLMRGFRGPIQRFTTKAWLKDISDQNLKSRVAFAIKWQDQTVGVTQLHSIDWIHRVAAFSIYLGSPNLRGLGLGFCASALVLDYAFNGLDLARVWLDVIASNKPAKALYSKLGFEHEGVLRSSFNLNGSRVDVDLYGILRGESKFTIPNHANRLILRD